MSGDDRAFHPHFAGVEDAALSPPPPGEHDWQPGGRGFRCPRCGVEKSVRVIARGPRRGTSVSEFFRDGKKLRREPGCKE